MGNDIFDKSLGEPADRVEGRAKVTGKAKYAAEYQPGKKAYGVFVTSTIAKGRIVSINSRKATSVKGVLAVISHLNRPEVPGWKEQDSGKGSRLEGKEFRLFYDDRIYHDQQPVALVIAESPGIAGEAASLVKVMYQKETHQTSLQLNHTKGNTPKRLEDHSRGDINAARSAAVKVEAVYSTPIQVHVPMEMHAATASWKGGRITDYNKSQAVKLTQRDLMKAFGLTAEQVDIQSPFVGGAFGSSSRVWPQEMAAVFGTKMTGRPVTVMAGREQVFNMVGYRPASLQRIIIGSDRDGKISGIYHEAVCGTSTYEEFTERIIDPTKTMYACANLDTSYKLVKLDMSTPCWTRGPGETSGSFALESAMDELAYELKMDPVELRLKNFAEKDPFNGLPWSSNYLKECYQLAAEKAGWSKRNPVAGSMREEDWMIGMGMGAGIYKSERPAASATAIFGSDGTLLVETSVADVGPGSATVMSQIAADALGIELSKVKFKWGNSAYPEAPGQFGSHTTAGTGTAVHEAVTALRKKLDERGKGLAVGQPEVRVTITSKEEGEPKKFSGKSFCAHFVEVMVHAITSEVRIRRVVTAVDAGKVLNMKAATSQVYGAITWGIGIALMEEGIVDHRYGRYVNNNLSDYHVPVNADIPEIDVIFIDKPDPWINPMGAKGLGEIGLVGLTAAIANAVFHATGKRIRSLPITVEKLL